MVLSLKKNVYSYLFFYITEPQGSGQQSDIYENIRHGDAGSSDGGDEDDWASDEFEEYETSYQSVSSDQGKKSKGPPTLPPRNPQESKSAGDQPLPVKFIVASSHLPKKTNEYIFELGLTDSLPLV